MFNYEKEYPTDWRNLVLSRVHGAKPFTMQRVGNTFDPAVYKLGNRETDLYDFEADPSV